MRHACACVANLFRSHSNVLAVFYYIYEFQCILNVLLECIELFNTVLFAFICADCSIREYRSNFSPLCWHNMPAYYALNYASIFDGGLVVNLI